MKAFTVVVLAIIAGTSGFLIKVPVAPKYEPVIAPSGWIHLQKLMLPLFENVCEVSTDPEICRLSQEFTTGLAVGDFLDPEVITKFQTFKTEKGFLPKGEIFSEYNPVHTNELIVVYDVMRNSKSFDSFYKVAAWARQNLNCGLYVTLIYLALENRRDTQKLTLPPPYELLPNYFIRKDIIIQGSSLLAGEEFTPSEGVRDEGNAYTLDANYTANFYDNDDESKLAYFREDIGLNSYYFLRMLKMAPWLNRNTDINSRYGEEMYHMMKQLVARYNLERYSNGIPEQDNLSWDSLFGTPYDPMLIYSNGNEFIHRTLPIQLPENEDKALLQTIESNIAIVVSHMKETGYNKIQILNNLMEILVTGERSYDILARQLLGKALTKNGQPTVFEHYMTSLRDPMIWRIYKKIVDLVDNALKILPPYAKNELYFPGVEVMNIDVKKMITSFDYFEFDITEALKIGNGDMAFQVKIGQSRLNHKPFVMKLNISSLITQKGLVKIYLGPKMMPGEFDKKKNWFSLLDSFEINLKMGSNIIKRTSKDMNTLSPDFISLKTLSNKVENAQFGLDSLPLNSIDSQISFPERLLIPKGTPEGLPLQLFVFVAPFTKSTVGGSYSNLNMEYNSAMLSPLYPLDLPMENGVLLNLPNALLKDLIVTHKSVNKISNYTESGATKSWFDKNTKEPSSKPSDYAGKEPFDYTSKKIQFGQDNNTLHANDQYLRDHVVNYNNLLQNDESSRLKQNLIASGYDDLTKQKQLYDYKSKLSQYTTDSSKRDDYKTSENSLDMDSDQMAEKQLLNETQDTDVFYQPDDLDNYHVDASMDQKNDKIQSNDSFVKTHYLLKSAGSQFSSKQKESIDSKSKRPKFETPDNKTMYKTIRKTIENPGNVIVEDDITEQRLQNTKKKESKNYNVIAHSIHNVENFEIPKIFEGNSNINAPKETSTNEYDGIFVEDIGYVDVFKVVKNKINEDFSDSKNDEIIEKAPDTESGEYYGVFKDGSNEEIVKVIPITKSPDPNYNKIYKNIMHHTQ